MNKIVFEYRGIKAFDDSGYFKALKFTSGTTLQLPVFAFDLTNRPRNGIGASTYAAPFMRMNMQNTGAQDGYVHWDKQNALLNSGTTPDWTIIERPDGNPDPASLPATDRTLLRWTDIRINCWGAKSKAVRYSIMIIKLLDQELDPFETDPQMNAWNSDIHQTFWQSQVKQFTWNPAAIIKNPYANKMKVLKNFDFIIQPSATTDGDADPQCKCVNIFNRWDRVINYRTTGVYATDDQNFTSLQQPSQTWTSGNSTDTRNKIIMLLRVSDYNDTSVNQQTNFDNALHGSFDLVVRKAETIIN